ncbi:hypothetical protein FHY64_16050 [Pelagovum pacificum]|uniref:Lipoprotein n=1 Tax=Pelagovum pacificum TaxID=2588711 RepID=A0A5C5GCJ9_9RHOB|nr:hypothetical protein [Pelagovum pacificum]QQA45034.1 hypothetical protein I8N54_16860 [Pelagovum pacificum]TNY31700.1 hypothetical protein FHY64_16050 [Pelagovum pacificum]
MRFSPLVLLLAGVAACGPVSPEQASRRCEDRARAAEGPQGSVTVGMNSRSGGFGGAEVSVSSDYLRGRDPLAVYRSCVYDLTGEVPATRPGAP